MVLTVDGVSSIHKQQRNYFLPAVPASFRTLNCIIPKFRANLLLRRELRKHVTHPVYFVILFTNVNVTLTNS